MIQAQYQQADSNEAEQDRQGIEQHLPIAKACDIDERIGIDPYRLSAQQRISKIPRRIQQPGQQMPEPQAAFLHAAPPITDEQQRHDIVQQLIGQPLPALRLPQMAQQQAIGQTDQDNTDGNTRTDCRAEKPAPRRRLAAECRLAEHHGDQGIAQHGEIAEEVHQAADQAGLLLPTHPQHQVQLDRQRAPTQAGGQADHDLAPDHEVSGRAAASGTDARLSPGPRECGAGKSGST
ncbi:hypothetical protein D3C80_1392970 [compost metagenome]